MNENSAIDSLTRSTRVSPLPAFLKYASVPAGPSTTPVRSHSPYGNPPGISGSVAVVAPGISVVAAAAPKDVAGAVTSVFAPEPDADGTRKGFRAANAAYFENPASASAVGAPGSAAGSCPGTNAVLRRMVTRTRPPSLIGSNLMASTRFNIGSTVIRYTKRST